MSQNPKIWTLSLSHTNKHTHSPVMSFQQMYFQQFSGEFVYIEWFQIQNFNIKVQSEMFPVSVNFDFDDDEDDDRHVGDLAIMLSREQEVISRWCPSSCPISPRRPSFPLFPLIPLHNILADLQSSGWLIWWCDGRESQRKKKKKKNKRCQRGRGRMGGQPRKRRG